MKMLNYFYVWTSEINLCDWVTHHSELRTSFFLSIYCCALLKFFLGQAQSSIEAPKEPENKAGAESEMVNLPTLCSLALLWSQMV
jgi:hypothetical protein